MQQTKKVTPDQPYRADSLDYNRVEERASQGYFRTFWSSYKGRVRGMLAGVAIGGIVGAAVGLLVVGALPEAVAALAFAGFTGAGAVLGAEMYGAAGSAAASRAAGLAEKHARMLDPVHKGNELSGLSDKLMMDGRGHHFQYPEARDKGKLFNWKSGILGGGVGAALGGLLAGTSFVASIPLLSGICATAGTAALAFGALGLSFGIDRSNLKAIFNQVDANSVGRIHDGNRGPDLGREQFRVIETDKQIAAHRLQRQESTFVLEDEYHPKIFNGAVKGLFRGLAGGAVAGTLIGGAIGVAAYGTALALGIGLASAGLLPVAAAFAGTGAMYGMKVFADAGREAGAESTARAMDNEFERNQQLKERGVGPAPKTPQKEHFLNVKAALLMAAVGAVAGMMMPGVLGLGALKLAGVATAGMATTSGLAVTAAAAVGGLFGAMYGVGGDSLKQLSRMTDWLYEKTYVVQNDRSAQPYVVSSQPEVSQIKEVPAATITQEDLSRMQERMEQRPARNFGQSVMATQNQPATQVIP